MTTKPEDICRQRIAARRASRALAERKDARISLARGLLALVFGLILYLAIGQHLLSLAWTLIGIPLFIVLVALHARNDRVLRAADRAIAHYEQSLARIEDRWVGTGDAGERHLDPAHPYAADLDLFGKGSLFELLCTCRTAAGEEILTRWLLAPTADVDALKERQAAVIELRDRIDLREDLHVLGEEVRANIDRAALAAWAALPARLAHPALPFSLAAISAVCVATVVAAVLGFVPPSLVAIVGIGEWIILRVLKSRVEPILTAVERPGRDLAILAAVLARFEREPVTSPRLLALKKHLLADALTASSRIVHLGRLVSRLRQKNNQVFIPFAIALLWVPQCAIAIERWRRQNGPQLEEWIRSIGELEAIAALSGHAWERPLDPFPEIVGDSGHGVAVFDGEGLRHPLLPSARSVPNDVRIDAALPLLLISGSNMSGKSTLLRTVGTNVVLALAGAPIRGVRLRLSPLAIGATLRVQDSLLAGASRFYAEITRLRLLVDLAAKSPPLLFLLDELLAGTNSHDRKTGAEAILRGLLARGAIGLATTHDLALAELETTLAPRAQNVHFEDFLDEGILRFDYRMRPGVVKKSNALALMRAIGLPVGE